MRVICYNNNSQKNEESLNPGYTVNLFKFTSAMEKMHLDDSGVQSIFAVVDEDGDGYIDEPRFISDEDGTFYPARDLDGDGKIGNTSLKYDEYMNAPDFIQGGIHRPAFWRGATHPTCTANLNKVRPPKYFKVLNNRNENGGVFANYIVKDTSGLGISDGGWYRESGTPDTMGGFFGNTKFYYGEGDGNCVVGTASADECAEAGLLFTKEYCV